MLLPGCQRDGGSPIRYVFRIESNQTRYRSSPVHCPFAKPDFLRDVLCAHDFSAPDLDFRARGVASKYSSRWRQARLRESSFRCKRLTIKPPSSVVTIRMASSAAQTAERISPIRWPSSTIDFTRSNNE